MSELLNSRMRILRLDEVSALPVQCPGWFLEQFDSIGDGSSKMHRQALGRSFRLDRWRRDFLNEPQQIFAWNGFFNHPIDAAIH